MSKEELIRQATEIMVQMYYEDVELFLNVLRKHAKEQGLRLPESKE